MTALALILMSDDEVARFGRPSDAGFGALQTARGLLPLSAMDVDARVAGVVASIEVAQTFVNTTGAAIEATYIFPLPDRAAVHRFRMEVAGRVVEGVIDERGVARERYDQAIATGHRAAITEEERPGVFTMRVGNLMPGEAATVRLSLVGPLPVDDGEVTFRFPLVVAPRYMPGAGLAGDQAGLGIAEDTSLVPDASRVSPPVRLPGCPNPVRLGLRVALADRTIHDVASSLHAITQSLRDAQVIEIQPGEHLDRDFILRWRLDGSELRSTLVCADDVDGRGGTFMMTMVPPSTQALSAKPREVVFVLDRSGSMEGWKMVAARRAVARMIDTLTSRDRFSVLAFDNVVEAVPELGLVEATDRNRFRTVEALAKIDARGGTELAQPLLQAVASLAGGTDDRERVVVLVTDGQVGNEDHILRELAPRMRNVRMFTLGIDQAVNAAFLRRLASAGGGLCELVESEDRLDVVMAKVHRRIGTPVATELAIRGSNIEIETDTVSPKKLPDVYAGSPVVIFGRYRGPAPRARIDVTGTSLGDPLRLEIDRGGEGGAWLAASWARAHIRDLEDRYATGARELEPRIVEVSKRFSVLSRFTAFLAIDRSEIVNPGGTLQQVVQPVEEPAGWDMKRSRGGGGPGGQHRAAPPRAMAAAPVMNRPAMPGNAMPMGGMPRDAGGFGGPPAMPGATRFGGLPAQPRPPTPGHMAESAPMPTSMPTPARAPVMPGVAAPSPDSSSFGQPPPSQGFNPSGSFPPPMAPIPAAEPPPPPAPMSVQPVFKQKSAAPPMKRSERADDAAPRKDEAAAPVDAYLAKLGTLARELEAQAKGRVDTAAIRLLRQRLGEWVEDLRSVGGREDLAAAVEDLVRRLSDALVAATALAGDALAIATALAELAAGNPPPPAPKKSRLAFWK